MAVEGIFLKKDAMRKEKINQEMEIEMVGREARITYQQRLEDNLQVEGMKMEDKLMMADRSGEEGMAMVMMRVVDREMILMECMHMMRVVDREMNVKQQQGTVMVGKRQRVVDGNKELN
jgi:hypothetical protein